MAFTQDLKHMSVSLLASNAQDIDYIGLSVAQHTWQFWIIEAQQHWYFLRHIGFMQIMNIAANMI